MRLPKSIRDLVEAFEKLPGIGPKTAQRLTFYLLHVPQLELDKFGQALTELKKKTKVCEICFNVDEMSPCSICQDEKRDSRVVCVVEEPFDVLALEKIGKFQGVYHVLGGAIRPLENIGPEELRIAELLQRLKENQIEEVILAMNPDTEGEATAIYIANKVAELKAKSLKPKALKLTRIGRGMSTNSSLEYTDDQTLGHALSNRREY